VFIGHTHAYSETSDQHIQLRVMHSAGPAVSTADNSPQLHIQRAGSSSGWCGQTALHFTASNYL